MKSAAAAILASVHASFCFAAASCINGTCTAPHRDWSVSVSGVTVIASTVSSGGGMLSHVCKAGTQDPCRWGLVLPDADCKDGSRVVLSLMSNAKSTTVSAKCSLLPRIAGMPGAGRSFLLDGDGKAASSAIWGNDVAVRTRNKSGDFIEHRFSRMGSNTAMVDTYLTLDRINASITNGDASQ